MNKASKLREELAEEGECHWCCSWSKQLLLSASCLPGRSAFVFSVSLLPASHQCCLETPVSCSVQAMVLLLVPRTLGFWRDASFSLCIQVEFPKLSGAGRGIVSLTNPDVLHAEEGKGGALYITGKQLNRSAKHCARVVLSYRRIAIKLYSTA